MLQVGLSTLIVWALMKILERGKDSALGPLFYGFVVFVVVLCVDLTTSLLLYAGTT